MLTPPTVQPTGSDLRQGTLVALSLALLMGDRLPSLFITGTLTITPTNDAPVVADIDIELQTAGTGEEPEE